MTFSNDVSSSLEPTVKVAKDLERIEELRGAWKQLGRIPNADIDFFQFVLGQRPEVLHPYVVLVSQEGEAKAMAIGRVEETALELGIGYKTFWRPRLRTLTIVHGGFLGEIAGSNAQILLRSLLEPLRSGEVEALRLSFVPVDSELLRLVRQSGAFFSRDRAIEQRSHCKMALPGTIDEVYASLSRDHRQQLRRKARSFEKAFPEGLEVRCFKQPQDLPRMIEDVEAIAQKTYQRGLGAGFIDNEENRKRVALEAECGWLRMYVLYVKGRPSTYWWGAVYEGTFHSFALGFDPEHGQYSPGTYLLTRVMEELCAANVKAVDFGLGDARYKRQFATEVWEEATVYLFAPTVRMALLNFGRTLNGGLVKGAKRVLEKFATIDTIKKRWRRKLTPQKTETESER